MWGALNEEEPLVPGCLRHVVQTPGFLKKQDKTRQWKRGVPEFNPFPFSVEGLYILCQFRLISSTSAFFGPPQYTNTRRKVSIFYVSSASSPPPQHSLHHPNTPILGERCFTLDITRIWICQSKCQNYVSIQLKANATMLECLSEQMLGYVCVRARIYVETNANYVSEKVSMFAKIYSICQNALRMQLGVHVRRRCQNICQNKC